jgi:hypothetical protein
VRSPSCRPTPLRRRSRFPRGSRAWRAGRVERCSSDCARAPSKTIMSWLASRPGSAAPAARARVSIQRRGRSLCRRITGCAGSRDQRARMSHSQTGSRGTKRAAAELGRADGCLELDEELFQLLAGRTARALVRAGEDLDLRHVVELRTRLRSVHPCSPNRSLLPEARRWR